ncbi:MAG: sulfotransferase [Kordiimonadaceae bacterium]|nr:sulfotransferase [Kordiimonadaceae bacterium]
MPDQIPHGDLTTALQHAARLLQQHPIMAEEQAREILKVVPDLDPAKHILTAALRLQGKIDQALEIVKPLAMRLSNAAPISLELGLCYAAAGRTKEAIAALKKNVDQDPKSIEGWRMLADQYRIRGEKEKEKKYFSKYLQLLTSNPELAKAEKYFIDGKIAQAEQLTKEILRKQPSDVVAMRLLGEIAIKLNRFEDAKTLLINCLELAPNFHHARNNYAIALFRTEKLEQAAEQLEILLSTDPKNPNYLILKSAILARKGDNLPALKIYEKILKEYPKQAKALLSYGHTLKTVGRLDDAIKAYRNCIDASPATGETYWSLANLKTFKFSDEDVINMSAQFEKDDGDEDDKAHLAFALGKAYEDREEFDTSFRYYQRGNAIRRRQTPYDAKINIYDTVRQIKFFDTEFFKKHKGQGCQAKDPIFVVGLPRAGSTLIEQILASHSMVEGTAELTDIIAMSREIGDKKRVRAVSKYPEILNEMTAEDFKYFGERYIETTRIQRSSLPYFIDKMPNNFQHIGLIHSILPNAKIIDARRHPMGGCFSGYKQLFARGQAFTYDLSDIGFYYRDYVKLMDHWDETLPGRVHRVQYEEMVSDTETQIRKLLEYCGLEFEESCLRFYETDRAIRTPSSEQVRQPIFTKGMEQWRNYETHLAPLKEALGPLLERYPIE